MMHEILSLGNLLQNCGFFLSYSLLTAGSLFCCSHFPNFIFYLTAYLLPFSPKTFRQKVCLLVFLHIIRREKDKLGLSIMAQFVFRIQNSAAVGLENHMRAEEMCMVKLQMRHLSVPSFDQSHSAPCFALFLTHTLAVKYFLGNSASWLILFSP